MRNISNKVAEKIKAHILRSITFFSKNYATYDIMWKNMAKPDKPQTTIQYSSMGFAYWITTATDKTQNM